MGKLVISSANAPKKKLRGDRATMGDCPASVVEKTRTEARTGELPGRRDVGLSHTPEEKNDPKVSNPTPPKKQEGGLPLLEYGGELPNKTTPYHNRPHIYTRTPYFPVLRNCEGKTGSASG